MFLKDYKEGKSGILCTIQHNPPWQFLIKVNVIITSHLRNFIHIHVFYFLFPLLCANYHVYSPCIILNDKEYVPKPLKMHTYQQHLMLWWVELIN